MERQGTALRVTRSGTTETSGRHHQPYAGFPTDVQAQFMALMALAQIRVNHGTHSLNPDSACMWRVDAFGGRRRD